jgi:acyl-CoA synthetase (AMP-forming)/AMP-acid ligase II
MMLDFSMYHTLVELLRQRAHQQPDQQAYTFLLDGEAAEAVFTYADLDCRARMIGALLQHVGATGERVLLLYPPGLEYIAAFFGCMYAGAIAVPAYPPNPARLERTLPRLQAIVADARPLVVLTTTPILMVGEMLAKQAPEFLQLRWYATDVLAKSTAKDWRDPLVGGESLAFLQYTSGSTAAPKGVMLTNANLLHNSSLIKQYFGHSIESRG